MSDPEAGPQRAVPIRATRTPSPASRSSHPHRPPPQDDLEKHKGIVKQLYLDDGLTLREVMVVMEKQHGVRASSKVYKSRFKTWGWRKNLRIQDEVPPNILQTLQRRSQQPTRDFQMVNGQVVHSERLERYLRRQKSRLLLVKRQLDHDQAAQSRTCPAPKSLVPPVKYHVIEELFYQILYQVPSYVRNRWGDAFIRTDVKGAIQLAHPTPSTDRWSLFGWGLRCMLAAGKYDEAMVFMRHAPQELDVFLKSQPTEILSCCFMMLAQGTRFCHPERDPQARQFLRVVRSLTKYAASVLFESAQASDSTWLYLVAVLIDVFSRIEDVDMTETVYRAWKIHSETWDTMMAPGVVAQVPLAGNDALSVAKYRALPSLSPTIVEVLQDIKDDADAQYGTQHETSMRSLWAFAQWMETDEDARGVVGGYSPRTRALFEELRRREPSGSVRISMWRFFADDHKARGEYREAEQSMRSAIEAVGDVFQPQETHPLVLCYVSTLKDWSVEGYGENSIEASEMTRWYDEVKSDAMESGISPSQTPTASPESIV